MSDDYPGKFEYLLRMYDTKSIIHYITIGGQSRISYDYPVKLEYLVSCPRVPDVQHAYQMIIRCPSEYSLIINNNPLKFMRIDYPTR